MTVKRPIPRGTVEKAPENHLGTGDILDVGDIRRRAFLRAGAAMGVAAIASKVGAAAGSEGEDAILELPAHSTTLGQPVAARGYGLPSVHEQSLQRRESPGLTRVSAASVAFAPLQG